MDYEELYKKALERAKKLKENPKAIFFEEKNIHVSDYIFPELRESEDEKIRNEIIESMRHQIDRFSDAPNVQKKYEYWIAWLEKQGESYTKRDVDDAYLKGISDAKNELEKQGEPQVRTGLEWLNTIDDACDKRYSEEYAHGEYCHEQSFKWGFQEGVEWLEKQGEQKPAGKVEPKFKVGDWVVTSYGKVNQVISIDNISVDKNDNGYTLDDGTYFSCSWCDMYHLWTIQDTKDGDVLVNGDEIVIFKKNSFNEKDLSGSMFVYCSLRNKKGSWYTIGGINPSNYLPATKAQRDKLFETMKEAGYEWDADEKELKKINSYCQEHCKGYQETGKCYADGECEAKKNAETGWSEEDENILNAITYTVKNSGYKHCIGVSNEIMTDWLESIKDRVQPKQEWSEEDERIFSEIILRCKKYGRQEQIDWLKSIKQRIGWKPNEEQMKALKCAIEDVAKFSKRYGLQVELENEPYYSALHSLYEQLKKLKGE